VKRDTGNSGASESLIGKRRPQLVLNHIGDPALYFIDADRQLVFVYVADDRWE